MVTKEEIILEVLQLLNTYVMYIVIIRYYYY